MSKLFARLVSLVVISCLAADQGLCAAGGSLWMTLGNPAGAPSLADNKRFQQEALMPAEIFPRKPEAPKARIQAFKEVSRPSIDSLLHYYHQDRLRDPETALQHLEALRARRAELNEVQLEQLEDIENSPEGRKDRAQRKIQAAGFKDLEEVQRIVNWAPRGYIHTSPPGTGERGLLAAAMERQPDGEWVVIYESASPDRKNIAAVKSRRPADSKLLQQRDIRRQGLSVEAKRLEQLLIKMLPGIVKAQKLAKDPDVGPLLTIHPETSQVPSKPSRKRNRREASAA